MKKIITSIIILLVLGGILFFALRSDKEKDTVIERVIDERGEGLEFNKDINAGWEEVDDVLYYRPIEGVSISSKDSREVKLVLQIKETTEIKTYINKLTSKGEIKEKVVYILDGRKVKEESVDSNLVNKDEDAFEDYQDDLEEEYEDEIDDSEIEEDEDENEIEEDVDFEESYEEGDED